MRKTRISTWNLARIEKEMGNKTLSFDYPIQRAGGQWDEEKKSLLIHSIACDFPVPPIYALAQREIVGSKQKDVLYILDGKQRLTSISQFLNNGFRLHDNTPPFTIEIDGEIIEHDFTKRKFDELPEEIKTLLTSYVIEIEKIENALDSDVEDIFYRLNNGVPLSTQQKAKAKLGVDMALKVKKVMDHPLLVKNASFTELQKKQAHDEVAVIQSLMLIDKDYTVGKFGTQEVYDYTIQLRDGKDNVIEELKLAMDLLHKALGDFKEKSLLKKINFPFVLYAAHRAVQIGWDGENLRIFQIWIESFKEKLASKTNGVYLDGAENPDVWLYKSGMGAGATKAKNVADRWTATNDSIDELLKEIKIEIEEEKKQNAILEQKRIEREKKDKAAKEKADKLAADKATKEKAAKEKADKAAKEKADKAAKDKADKEKADKEKADKLAADKAAAPPNDKNEGETNIDSNKLGQVTLDDIK